MQDVSILQTNHESSISLVSSVFTTLHQHIFQLCHCVSLFGTLQMCPSTVDCAVISEYVKINFHEHQKKHMLVWRLTYTALSGDVMPLTD